MVLNASY